VNNGLGLTLSGPMTQIGHATTTPGGAIYYARPTSRSPTSRTGWKPRGRSSRTPRRSGSTSRSRNTGTRRLRDAVMASLNWAPSRRRATCASSTSLRSRSQCPDLSVHPTDSEPDGRQHSRPAFPLRSRAGALLQWRTCCSFRARGGRATRPSFFSCRCSAAQPRRSVTDAAPFRY